MPVEIMQTLTQILAVANGIFVVLIVLRLLTK
jgi:hypothetical protein